MLKILLPTPDAPPRRGGVARYIASLLAARPEVVLEVLPEDRGTVWILRHMWGAFLGYDELWTSHVVPVGTVCWLLSFIKKVPYVVFLHGLDIDLARRNVWKRFLARRILARAKRVVTNSVALQQEVAAFAGREDVVVLHPCVSRAFEEASVTVRKGLAHYTPEQLAKMFVSQMVGMTGAGISVIKKDSSEVVKLLTVARLVERKGHTKVLQAMKDIPNVTYTIVGDGPEREALEARAKELEISDRVTFLSRVTDAELPALYTVHDIFVMPTTKSHRDREGFGIVYAEAGIFGLPSIATDIPGVDEVIERDVTGLLIEDTPDALKDAIEKLVASSGLRSRMGSSARSRVLERFTEGRFSERVHDI